ncbi:hypothetical protein MHH28_02530 [Paenibacillus sp. FSL K6-1217]|uniref:hypothetical protein n=1 Tax=Paenibacillus sp. FSL K6-1217 TaxID=2921466 RepID=UPI00324B1865
MISWNISGALAAAGTSFSFVLRSGATAIPGGRAFNTPAPIAPDSISLGATLIVPVTGVSETIDLFNDGDSAAVTSAGGRLAAQVSIVKLS